MTNAYEELLTEARERTARLEGELAALRDQLTTAMATETQLRVELEASRTELTSAQAMVAHAQHLADQQAEASRRLTGRLEAELEEARRLQHDAEHERAAVIAALGRRARRRLSATS
jgi:DNA repair exonuclease SbcCD ATPase subunit